MESNVILLIVVGALILALLVWLLLASRRTRVEIETRRDEEPARRNQALIDSAPAATSAPAAPDPAPVAEAASLAGEPAAPAGQDDLTRIKGLGPKIAEQLRTMGVVTLAQIAAWDDAEIDRIDAQLGRFQGRIRRDDWPGQARLLAAGDTAGYEARFGRL